MATCARPPGEPRAARRQQVVAYDFGIKQNILREPRRGRLPRRGAAREHDRRARCWRSSPTACSSPTAPATRRRCTYAIETVRELIGKVPIFGICLGHQILGLALGGSTYKLKFGHRGANQPVKDLATGQVEITAQNHGFAVDRESLEERGRGHARQPQRRHGRRASRHRTLPVFSVQYHPEASPGAARRALPVPSLR